MTLTLKIIFIGLLTYTAAWSSTCPTEIEGKNICASVEWERGPLWGGFSKATVTYHKKNNPEQKVELPKDIILYTWMVMEDTEHGGRTPKITQKSKGVYEVDQLQFMKMGTGGWQLRWRKKKTHERKDALAVYSVPLGN